MPSKLILQSIPVGGGAWNGVIPYNALIDDPTCLLLLPGTGTTGSTTISNTGYYPVSMTAAGNTQIAATPSKFGGGSIWFDGTGDYLAQVSNAAYDITTGDFTVEAWINLNTYGSGSPVPVFSSILCDTRSSGNAGFILAVTDSGLLFYCGGPSLGDVSVTSTTAVGVGVWVFVAAVRQSGVVSIYVNSAREGTVGDATNYSSSSVTVGTAYDHSDGTSDFKIDGYLNDFRYSSVARYSGSSITIPSAPLPNASASVVYLPQGPAAGQLALSNYYLYACTDSVGPVWERTATLVTP